MARLLPQRNSSCTPPGKYRVDPRATGVCCKGNRLYKKALINPRDPITSEWYWNLNTMCFGGDWTPAENLTGA